MAKVGIWLKAAMENENQLQIHRTKELARPHTVPIAGAYANSKKVTRENLR